MGYRAARSLNRSPESKNFEGFPESLDETLERMNALNRPKYTFTASSIDFLGYRITGQGIYWLDEYAEAVHNAS